MIFFDSQNPNKYKSLKKLIRPSEAFYGSKIVEFERIGEGDGSYVIPKNSPIDTVLSYGIGSDAPFEDFMLQCGSRVYMYDGSIKKLPFKAIGGTPIFYKEFLTKDNFKNHVEGIKGLKRLNSCLKMDIDGCEYDCLNKENLKLAAESFSVLCLELHSLIEEIPQGWELTKAELNPKQNPDKVIDFFKRIEKDFFIWHIHANNHGPRYVDFPDCLEITFLNKNVFTPKETDIIFPIEGLDKPNYNGREDYFLDWWV